MWKVIILMVWRIVAKKYCNFCDVGFLFVVEGHKNNFRQLVGQKMLLMVWGIHKNKTRFCNNGCCSLKCECKCGYWPQIL